MKVPSILASLLLLAPVSLLAGQDGGPLRILFLGHKAAHHPSDRYYPVLAKALGRDAIYFDYHTSVEAALGDADYLNQFDGLLLYANHDTIEPHQHRNLTAFVENGGGFIPVHCASYCFRNEPGFIKLCGGQFKSHRTGVFTTRIVAPDHPAMAGVKEFEAWDETYVHARHGDDRTILMVREPAGPDDNITEPEPWTWTREQGKGRVFYTASGHDHRVWSQPAFHQLLKSGMLWAVGDERRIRLQLLPRALVAPHRSAQPRHRPLPVEQRNLVGDEPLRLPHPVRKELHDPRQWRARIDHPPVILPILLRQLRREDLPVPMPDHLPLIPKSAPLHEGPVARHES